MKRSSEVRQSPASPGRIPLSYFKTALKCPDCGGFVVRIRRRPSDRILSVFKPVRRIGCADCNWQTRIPRTRLTIPLFA
jgi:hypothetical protein